MEQKQGSPCLKKGCDKKKNLCIWGWMVYTVLSIQQKTAKCWHIIMKSLGGYVCQVYAL